MRGLIATTALLAGVQAAVDPIVIKGSKFFMKNSGEQFFMKGVAYQQEVNSNTTATSTDGLKITDPLADSAACKRDIAMLKKLDTNTIRVYAIDPSKDHTDCMSQLADAGIYVVADLSEPGLSINRDDPGWTVDLYNRYTSVVDEMMKFDNTLGFFAGNEVSNQPNNTVASAFVKAAVRDTKAYIKSKNYREIGVGYATNDDAEIRENMANYFDCGDRDSAIDFWGYNIYSWCGASSFTKSGYDVQTKNFEKYNVPVFFAEYGCNTPRPRLFTEVQALYGKDMYGIWSGGIVYMYFEEENQFGLVSIKDGKAVPNDDFDNLSSQIAKATPAESDPLPPPANANLCSCMMETLSCVVDEKTDEEDYGDIFGFGINKNATSGPYGVYGMCSNREQLSFAVNAYAKKNSGGCSFKGKATTQSANPSPTASGCASLSRRQVTSSAGAGSGSGSGSTGAASALSTDGVFGLGLYMLGAVASGMAMILL
ncbi:Glucanosyltransferase-domain-containing protein [Bipolaris maydis]|nr:Glucanosyltransferase-domain-containing protein [Bipolaris maydis]